LSKDKNIVDRQKLLWQLQAMLKNGEILNAEQANKLVYSSYEMTLNEKRLLMLVICKLSMNMKAFPLMYVKVLDLKEYLEIEGESLSSNLRNTCRRLLKRLVEIESENGDWIAYQWVSQCRVIKGTGVLEIELHKNLKPFLLQLNGLYQSIPFEHIAKIHKSHAVRIFEILWHKRNESRLSRNKVKIDLVELRKMLALGKRYPVFYDFRKRILEPAKVELGKSTPIGFTYEVGRTGKTPVSITFTVYDNNDYKVEKLPPLTVQMMLELSVEEDPKRRKKIINGCLVKTLNHNNWKSELKLLENKGRTIEQIEESASWAVEEIDRKSKTSNVVENVAGFVRWAVRVGKK